MDTLTIINLISSLVPVVESVGLDIVTIIQGLKAGKTAAQLATEAVADRNDLPNLTFGISGYSGATGTSGYSGSTGSTGQ